MQKRISVARPDLTGNEEKYLVDAFRSSWISSTGAYINRFEEEFAAFTGTRYAIGVCNGTVALHVALLALDVRPGDEVLVPSLTFIATANAVRYMGAEPVFIDVDPETWCMDPAKIEAAITVRTKGIIAVDLYGHPADMDRINHLAAIHGLWVVEDAAEAHGALYKGRPVGGLADIGTFSFFGNKIITSGEGGALTVNSEKLKKRIMTLRGQGMDPERRYYFPVVGYNFRLTNLACALLCAQLERYDAIVGRRRAIFAAYNQALAGIPGICFQPVAEWAKPAPWLYCITVDAAVYGAARDELMKALDAAGVETRPFFIPVHSLPPYREGSERRREHLPVTDSLAASGFNLPTYAEMTDDDVARICEVIRGFRR